MESSGNAEQQGEAKAVLMLRVVPPLKARLAAYARERGLTLNAAAAVLLDQALGDPEARTLPARNEHNQSAGH
ncbi:MAG: hypothetical protein ACRDOD_16555 [Streptosporangiaceae bacterium]